MVPIAFDENALVSRAANYLCGCAVLALCFLSLPTLGAGAPMSSQHRTGQVLSNPYFWIVLQMVLALLPFWLIRPPARAIPSATTPYKTYSAIAICAMLAALIDDPGRSSGASGLLSMAVGALAGLPWTMFLDRLVGRTFQEHFARDDATLMSVWLCIGINQLLLGLVAFWPKRR